MPDDPSDEVLRKRVMRNAGAIRYTAKVAEMIDRHGAMIQGTVGKTGENLTYTVGLAEAGYPEIVMSGLPPRVAARILQRWALATLGQTWPFDLAPTPPQAGWLDDGTHVVLIRVDDPADVPLTVAVARAANVDALAEEQGSTFRIGELEAIQVVVPDADGRFPWDEGCAFNLPGGRKVQPLYGPAPAPPA